MNHLNDTELIWEAYAEEEDSLIKCIIPDKTWIAYGILQKQDMDHIIDNRIEGGARGQAFTKLLQYILHHAGGNGGSGCETLDLEFGEMMMGQIDQYGESAGGWKSKEYFEMVNKNDVMTLISTEA